MRVFFDTNIWVSAFAGSTLCGDLISDCLRDHEVLSSKLVREEMTRVLERKIKPSETEWKKARALWSFCRTIPDAAASVGDNDSRLIAAAGEAGAELFVTGDKALLEYIQTGTMRIVAPREAWLILFSPVGSR